MKAGEQKKVLRGILRAGVGIEKYILGNWLTNTELNVNRVGVGTKKYFP